MSEVLFYHLTEHSLEKALPGLLERCLERDWKVAVQTGSDERCEALDAHLWTFKDESFLPHGREGAASGEPADHPIWLTTTTANPTSADVRFLVDGAVPAGTENYVRVIYMFDGRDEYAVAEARERWKIERQAGHDLTYWQQDDEGRWAKKA